MKVLVRTLDERVRLAGFDDEHAAGLPPDALVANLGETGPADGHGRAARRVFTHAA